MARQIIHSRSKGPVLNYPSVQNYPTLPYKKCEMINKIKGYILHKFEVLILYRGNTVTNGYYYVTISANKFMTIAQHYYVWYI